MVKYNLRSSKLRMNHSITESILSASSLVNRFYLSNAFSIVEFQSFIRSQFHGFHDERANKWARKPQF